ncbi:cation diffusion facilitator family transporter [Acetobacteraceae bacterium KSS8]|uniref:Cation diffusion facilitator family transporter n=1 Tax=Endosaccharibacter trunci TaxID=2812733 RepID=A0ABT1W790_9PROT|nr:cation diffusion facilitator family transporter [Acetobacteraceae bacterium KSS8]
MSRAIKIGWCSLLVSVVVLGMKAGAYLLTGSVALYSDALETVINVVAAAGALTALWFSELPPDDNHPYGHHKAEYLSAVVEGALVLATSAAILHGAWDGWNHPHRPTAPFLGIGLNAAAGVINLLWALVLLRCGRRWKSPALTAGGKHLMTDVWTTGGVLMAFALVPLTGELRIDATVAALVALHILWVGYRMLRESVGGLMDEVQDPDSLNRLRRAISENADGAIEAHDLRSRTAGSVTFVEFHLVVPGQMTVEASHAICDRLEAALREEVGEAVISIHVEPEPKAKLVGVPVL